MEAVSFHATHVSVKSVLSNTHALLACISYIYMQGTQLGASCISLTTSVRNSSWIRNILLCIMTSHFFMTSKSHYLFLLNCFNFVYHNTRYLFLKLPDILTPCCVNLLWESVTNKGFIICDK